MPEPATRFPLLDPAEPELMTTYPQQFDEYRRVAQGTSLFLCVTGGLLFTYILALYLRRQWRQRRARSLRLALAQHVGTQLPESQPFRISDEDDEESSGEQGAGKQAIDSSDDEEDEQTPRAQAASQEEFSDGHPWDTWELSALVILVVYVPTANLCVGGLLLAYPAYDPQANGSAAAAWLGTVLVVVSCIFLVTVVVHCVHAQMDTRRRLRAVAPSDAERGQRSCCAHWSDCRPSYECLYTLSFSLWGQDAH